MRDVIRYVPHENLELITLPTLTQEKFEFVSFLPPPTKEVDLDRPLK